MLKTIWAILAGTALGIVGGIILANLLVRFLAFLIN